MMRTINSLATLYMLLIMVRWFAPWLSLDVKGPRLSWIVKLTDPFINIIRKHLPKMGPLDFGPIAALFLVWIAKTLILKMMLNRL